jgi:hypothetical protein
MGDEVLIKINNLNDSLEKYILENWPNISFDLEHYTTTFRDDPIDVTKSIKDLKLKKNHMIQILGCLKFIYHEKNEIVKIESKNHKISFYINQTKFEIDADYVYCYFNEEEIDAQQRIRSLNLKNTNVINLIDSKIITVTVKPHHERISLGEQKETLTGLQLKGTGN